MDASDIGLTWLDESERKQLWGISYQENNTKIHQAVQETDGQIFILWRADDFARLVFCGKWNDKEQQRGVRRRHSMASAGREQMGSGVRELSDGSGHDKETNDTVAETRLPGLSSVPRIVWR